ncbi:hypothetical protein MUG91_G42n133 [Manis pentadactyla]|nr:hypothetical protein MUG91_G42n133 [Manis pentadactyla]
MRPGSIQILPWEFQHRKWEKDVNLSWDSQLVKWEPQVFLVLIYGQSTRNRTREIVKFGEGRIVWNGTKIQTLCTDLHPPTPPCTEEQNLHAEKNGRIPRGNSTNIPLFLRDMEMPRRQLYPAGKGAHEEVHSE